VLATFGHTFFKPYAVTLDFAEMNLYITGGEPRPTAPTRPPRSGRAARRSPDLAQPGHGFTRSEVMSGNARSFTVPFRSPSSTTRSRGLMRRTYVARRPR
jgi:hypothetical protein